MSVYVNGGVTLHNGDCLDVMAGLPSDSVDAICTDPPYGLGFMGKAWDDLPPGEDWARECLRVLKPGGHLLAFGGTRTWHRLAVAVEDAGFEIRDSIAWLYGSGFPKSLDVSKAIDKAAGAERVASGDRGAAQCTYLDRGEDCPGHDDAGQSMSGATVHRLPTAPATDAARQWQGWGTALKPAFEPVVVARKPLTGTVAANVLTHGVGALNIDACRLGEPSEVREQVRPTDGDRIDGWGMKAHTPYHYPPGGGGRWPANVTLDEHQADALDRQTGPMKDGVAVQRNGGGRKIGNTVYSGSGGGQAVADAGYGGGGGGSRFFYVAKAPKKERPVVIAEDGTKTAHPTVKPLALMRWLVRLVTPPDGVVLEPFAGSGTTVEACILEGFRCIAIEREAEYLPLILARIERANQAEPTGPVERDLFDELREETA